jgi:ADP-ribosylglycohydrolase
MRAAPLGAFFAQEPIDIVVREAFRSAEVTHCHPEGKAGAAVVAVAAWLAARSRGRTPPEPSDFFAVIANQLHSTVELRIGVERAAALPPSARLAQAVEHLGNGSKVMCQDTVPLCLWIAATRLDDFTAAVSTTLAAGGDVDTLAAIVGGIVAARVGPDGIPGEWRAYVEPIPYHARAGD